MTDSKQSGRYKVKPVHFGPEDADLLPWVEQQTNFSGAVKALIRKELGLTPPPSQVDAEAIKALVERLVNERLAQIQGKQQPKDETKSEQKGRSDEPPPDLFKGIF